MNKKDKNLKIKKEINKMSKSKMKDENIDYGIFDINKISESSLRKFRVN